MFSMRTLGSMFTETYASWLDSISHCCSPLVSRSHVSSPECEAQADVVRVEGRLQTRILSRADDEKFEGVFHRQPAPEPAPSAGPLSETLWPSGTGHTTHEQATRNERSMSGSSRFSMRRRLLSSSSSWRRPSISAPSNFRHLYSDSFQFPPSQARHGASPVSFRPLELSIYDPNNRLSPLIPDFDIDQHVPPPPAAHTRRENSWDDNSVTLTHERSNSSMSFHIPRRPIQGHDGSSFMNSPDSSPPRVPPRSRARAYTAPNVDRMVERIASAMLEKERLQAEIDSIVERQSIYTNSRPTTAYGMQDLGPMPSIPALPAAAPSFAERLSVDSTRPQTAPPTQPIHIPQRQKSFAEAVARFNNSPVSNRTRDEPERPLAPPLPLVLRPPLRKKKSFSRVSSWLFPGGDGQHQRDISLDSLTNQPRPVTDKEGFYQIASQRRISLDSVTTGSSQWQTEEEDGDKSATVPTTWSPGSSPMTVQESPTNLRPSMVDRMATGTFGKRPGYRPQSVGVAF